MVCQYVVLIYAAPCYYMLCNIMQCHSILLQSYSMQPYAIHWMRSCVVLCYSATNMLRGFRPLCYITPCHSRQFYAILCYAMMFNAIDVILLRCSVQCHAIWRYVILCSSALCYVVMRSFMSPCTAVNVIITSCSNLFYVMLFMLCCLCYSMLWL